MFSINTPKKTMLLLAPILIGASIFSQPIFADEAFILAAKKTVSCRDLTNAKDRLDCFDASTKKLASLITPDKSVAKVPETSSQDSSTTDSSVTTAGDSIPTWAAAPRHTKEELSQEKRQSFETTIVRITVNNEGKHSFYTKDGAVWKQTQKDKVLPPRSLPALAEIRRKRTGNPTIKFVDVSNRSYRVLRIK